MADDDKTPDDETTGQDPVPAAETPDEQKDREDPQPGHHDSSKTPVTEYRGVQLDPDTVERT